MENDLFMESDLFMVNDLCMERDSSMVKIDNQTNFQKRLPYFIFTKEMFKFLLLIIYF